jgi:hypothetical protein
MNVRLIDALLIERRGYEMRGLKDRVRLIDEQLRALGYIPENLPATEIAAVERIVEKAAAKKAIRRKA